MLLFCPCCFAKMRRYRYPCKIIVSSFLFIGRVDMKLLDSPINKNEETIILQGYLYRRILAMQHGQNKSIVYDTVYKQLSIDAPSAAALRKKKADVRSKIKTLLDYWKKEKFIAGYVENKRGQEMYSVTIRLKNE